jgi:FkbM family methyltransferase
VVIAGVWGVGEVILHKNEEKSMSLRSWISPFYTSYLEWICGDKGLERTMNGICCRMQPKFRKYFPPKFDPAVAEYFKSKVKPGDFCLNVGANLGVMAVQFGAWSAPSGKIGLVEPNPSTRKNLEVHLKMNGLMERSTVLPFAISGSEGEADFFCHESDGMSRLGEANPLLQNLAKPVKVPVKKLDSLLPLEGKDPSVIMMDIEGFELAALEGGEKYFARAFPKAIVVELHPDAWHLAGTKKENLDDFINRHGLKIIPLSGQKDIYTCHGHVAFEKN